MCLLSQVWNQGERKSSQRDDPTSICKSYCLSEFLALKISYRTAAPVTREMFGCPRLPNHMRSVSKTATLSSKLHVGKGRAQILQTMYTLNNLKKIVRTFVNDVSDYRNNSRFEVEYSHKLQLDSEGSAPNKQLFLKKEEGRGSLAQERSLVYGTCRLRR